MKNIIEVFLVHRAGDLEAELVGRQVGQIQVAVRPMPVLAKHDVQTAVVFGVEVVGVRATIGRQQKVVETIAVDVTQGAEGAVDGQAGFSDDLGDAGRRTRSRV